MELRQLIPNHGVNYSSSLASWASEGSLRWSCMSDSVWETLSHCFLHFREVWTRTKFRKSSSPSCCWPQWQNQGCLVMWAGPWLSPACLPSVKERDSLSLRHLCLVVICWLLVCVCHFYTLLCCFYLSCCMASCSFPQRESWQSI